MLHLINAKKTNSRKHGFSLIETVIGMALLLIVIIIVYQGFVSTTQLSANTANYEAAGDIAAGMVNKKISNAATNPAPVYAIHLEIGGYTKNLGVVVYKAISVADTSYGVTEFKEVSPASCSTNRIGFWYAGTPLS